MCKKSESIAKLSIALVKAQSEITPVSKDGNNPHFRSKYATLDNIIDETRPILAKYGLAILQMPGGDGENVIMRTMLMHESGEWLETEPLVMRPVKNDPQGMGSCITYARRYSYAALLSISTDEDDDGNAASKAPQASQNAPRSQVYQQPSKPVEAPTSQSSAPSNTPKPISDAQLKMIGKTKTDKGVPDEKYRAMLSKYGVESTKDLTSANASKLIGELQAYIPVPNDPTDDLPF